MQDSGGNDVRLGVEADGVNFSALGFLPIGPVDLFARAGFISWDASLNDPTFGESSDDGMDFSYGAGAQFRVWSLTLRAEYELFDVCARQGRHDLDRRDVDVPLTPARVGHSLRDGPERRPWRKSLTRKPDLAAGPPREFGAPLGLWDGIRPPCGIVKIS